MATVIDSLLVEVGFDTTKIEKGEKTVTSSFAKIKDSAQKGGKEVEKSSKDMEESFAKVSTRLLEMATLFTGGVGITAFLGYVVKSTAEIGRLARVLDTSTQQLWTFDKLGTQVGGKAGDIAGDWQRLVHTFNDFAIGLPAANAKFIRFFTEQGVQFTDSKGKLNDLKTVYLQLAKTVEGMDRARGEAYLRGLGLGPTSINLILEGQARIRKSFDETKRDAPTPEQARKMEEAQKKFNVELAKTETIGRNIASILLPPFNGLLTLLDQIVEKTDWSIKKQIESWGRLFDWIVEKEKGVWNKIFKGTRFEATPGKPAAPEGDMGVGGSGTNFNDRFGSWPGISGSRSSGAQAPTGGGVGPRSDVGGREPASVRYNNPGAQYPSSRAKAFGMEGYGVIGGGHLIARFPSPEAGAAANMDLYSRSYVGMPIGAAGQKWTGSNGFGVPGYDSRQVVTPEMARDPAFMIPFMKAIAGREAGRKSQLSDEQWQKAFQIYQAGGLNKAQSDQQPSTFGNNARAVPWLTNPAAFALFPGGRGTSNTTNNSSTAETHVGSVTVQTQATDAYGIAKDLKGALERFNTVGNTNNGPN